MNKIEYQMFEYDVVATWNGEYVGVSVSFPKTPNPFQSSVNDIIENHALMKFGLPEDTRVVSCWGHNPEMRGGRYGNYDNLDDVWEEIHDVMSYYLRDYVFVYEWNGQYDYYATNEPHYMGGFIPTLATILCVVNVARDDRYNLVYSAEPYKEQGKARLRQILIEAGVSEEASWYLTR